MPRDEKDKETLPLDHFDLETIPRGWGHDRDRAKMRDNS
jgi:hypothetical protein